MSSLIPFDPPASHDIRHILGNIGHPGLTLLVAPQEPKIRKPSDAFNVVAHAPYDFQRENNFTGTSLHLSFTDWKFPLNPSDERTIGQEVMVVESVISVLDRGADLDIMCIDFKELPRIATVCDKHERNTHDSNYDYFSIDSWDELLDEPEGVGIFRAHENWAARLAAVSILSRQGQAHIVLGSLDVSPYASNALRKNARRECVSLQIMSLLFRPFVLIELYFRPWILVFLLTVEKTEMR